MNDSRHVAGAYSGTYANQMEGENMVKIHHILKDGTKVDSIEGHMIKAEEFKVLYEVINKINEKEQKHETV